MHSLPISYLHYVCQTTVNTCTVYLYPTSTMYARLWVNTCTVYLYPTSTMYARLWVNTCTVYLYPTSTMYARLWVNTCTVYLYPTSTMYARLWVNTCTVYLRLRMIHLVHRQPHGIRDRKEELIQHRWHHPERLPGYPYSSSIIIIVHCISKILLELKLKSELITFELTRALGLGGVGLIKNR